MKSKKCKICQSEYQPRVMGQKACSPECAIRWGKKERERKQEKERRGGRERIKPRKEWMKDAQKVFNEFIRERDKNEPCISCQKFHTGQYHAGHYLSVGARPEMRFHESNIWKQCSICNNHLSGNLINYRINLIRKIGVEKVEWLEGKHEAKRYTIDDLKGLIKFYRMKIKDLRDG